VILCVNIKKSKINISQLAAAAWLVKKNKKSSGAWLVKK